MSRLALLTAVCVLASPALAEAPSISCRQAQAQVAAGGAAVVHSSRNIYDRFVTDRRFCEVTQATRAAFIATTDAQFCSVGYRCVETNITRVNR